MTEPRTHENMVAMRPFRLLLVVTSLAMALAACASDGTGSGSGEAAGASTPPSTAPATPSPQPSPSHEDGSHENGSSDDGHEGGSHEATGPEAEALLALCRVVTQLDQGNAAAAEATFEDDAHETLHEVAHQLEGVDRAASAELLQAKSKVEAWLAQADPDVDALRADVEGLIAAFADSLAALDLEAPACPQEAT